LSIELAEEIELPFQPVAAGIETSCLDQGSAPAVVDLLPVLFAVKARWVSADCERS
jgi:hypothetical protein